MKILSIDTTEAACSAALLHGDEILERFMLAPRQHTEKLLPMLDAILAEAQISLTDLDGLGYACGPGSFTGVRIAAAAIQGIAIGAELPVAPVSSLLALAQGAVRQHQANQVLAGFDARMHEVYWASCVLDHNGFMQIQNKELLCAPSKVPIPTQDGWQGAGSAWAEYGDILHNRLNGTVQTTHPSQQVHAQDVARLAKQALLTGDYVNAEQALPVYLRNQVAKKSTPKQITP